MFVCIIKRNYILDDKEGGVGGRGGGRGEKSVDLNAGSNLCGVRSPRTHPSPSTPSLSVGGDIILKRVVG